MLQDRGNIRVAARKQTQSPYFVSHIDMRFDRRCPLMKSLGNDYTVNKALYAYCSRKKT